MFDSHVHIIDPRFPLGSTADGRPRSYRPTPFTVDDYVAETDGLGVTGGAVVAASFQGTDQNYLLDALRRLGAGWVGVTQLPFEVTDEEIHDLDGSGVRALRFNLRRGVADISILTEQAVRAHDIAGWHSEIYVDAGSLRSLEPIMSKLPAFSIDHLGMADSGLPYLLDLVDRGARVKATGFGRISHDPVEAMRRIHAVNPEALMFGTDLPGIRAGRRFEAADLDLVADAVGGDLQAVLFQNARRWYRQD